MGIFGTFTPLSKKALPESFFFKWIYEGTITKAIPLMKVQGWPSTLRRVGRLNNGVWTLGSRSARQEFVPPDQTIHARGIVDSIATPAMVLDAEKRSVSQRANQEKAAFSAQPPGSHLVTLTTPRELGEHCQMGGQCQGYIGHFDGSIGIWIYPWRGIPIKSRDGLQEFPHSIFGRL